MAFACVVVTIALLAYTYFGYPIAIGILARLFPVRWSAAPDDVHSPSITVFLPVFNGGAYLPAKVASLLAQDYPEDRIEILIYCDGCTDDTESIARAVAASAEARGRVHVIVSSARSGKPTALNTMAGEARGDLLLMNDVRQPLNRGAFRALERAMRDPRVGCATGNLVLDGPAGSGVYWRYENWMRAQESAFRGMFGMTGPLAMMWRADFSPVPANVVLDDVLIPMRLALQGKRVVFVAEAEAHDAAFEDDREFKRKARTLAGNYQVFGLLPALLSPISNPIWFETISHKILRLCAPWLMLILAAASIASAVSSTGTVAIAMWILVVGQAAFYAAAIAGPRGGRIAGVARTFVVLNAAALVGLGRHLTGRQRVTW